ncbi:hypothetical protein [Nocardioides sp. GXQ0305]|uniref:hypothetical protein n=1 Tax=Nocardioides sp. GXQ0305 TaxID=3423912 RepID=UPI003D7CA552
MAEDHWRHHLPNAYSRIEDRPRFFGRIADEAQSQLEDLEEALRGEEPPGETFAQRMARYQAARTAAEEIVVREVLFDPPSETRGVIDGQ